MYSTKIKQITNDTIYDDSVAAIKRFQLANGLEVDGIIGPLTWAALFPDATSTVTEATGEEKTSDALSAIIEKVKALCDEQVKNKSQYVWGAGGELGTKSTESWIRKKENRYKEGARADDAVNAWQEQLDAGNTAFRLFDCSGFVSWILTKAGVFSGRRDCDGLFALCNKIEEPREICLLFHVNSKNYEDETHVGLYIDGYVYHCKCRGYGVVCEKYRQKDWAKIGWWKALDKL